MGARDVGMGARDGAAGDPPHGGARAAGGAGRRRDPRPLSLLHLSLHLRPGAGGRQLALVEARTGMGRYPTAITELRAASPPRRFTGIVNDAIRSLPVGEARRAQAASGDDGGGNGGGACRRARGGGLRRSARACGGVALSRVGAPRRARGAPRSPLAAAPAARSTAPVVGATPRPPCAAARGATPPPPPPSKLAAIAAATPAAGAGGATADALAALADDAGKRGAVPRGRRPYRGADGGVGAVPGVADARGVPPVPQAQAESPCSDLGGFTRLLNTPNQQPDGLMDEVPTVVVKQLKPGRCDECDHGFVVMNRPWGVLQLLEHEAWGGIAEEEVLLMETDHLLLRAPPNRATPTKPVGFGFYYMTYRYDPAEAEAGDRQVPQPRRGRPRRAVAGDHLEGAAPPGGAAVVGALSDAQARQGGERQVRMGARDVGMQLATARLGIRHTVVPELQAEPGGDGIRGGPLASSSTTTPSTWGRRAEAGAGRSATSWAATRPKSRSRRAPPPPPRHSSA